MQNEGSARLRTPGRPFGTYSTCSFPAHDHTTSTGRNREALDVPAPTRCRRGGQRAHYDELLLDCRHENPATGGCLVNRRDT
ncbi:hypothetical protein [Micromonospora sp. NPDC005806]|uniref:hypothetical protein n=1 Tax=Micromonospora sp. NPDC005806 TaxID=3364234 RepID=UPI003689E1A5